MEINYIPEYHTHFWQYLFAAFVPAFSGGGRGKNEGKGPTHAGKTGEGGLAAATLFYIYYIRHNTCRLTAWKSSKSSEKVDTLPKFGSFVLNRFGCQIRFLDASLISSSSCPDDATAKNGAEYGILHGKCSE